MSDARWIRVRSRAVSASDKAAVSVACAKCIAEDLKPRFLPEIRPTEFNYPIDILGKWRGSKFSFIQRYRSGFPHNRGEEFDAAFTRLDAVDPDGQGMRFDVMWHRHTGQWFRLYPSVSLAEALHLIGTNPMLQPL